MLVYAWTVGSSGVLKLWCSLTPSILKKLQTAPAITCSFYRSSRVRKWILFLCSVGALYTAVLFCVSMWANPYSSSAIFILTAWHHCGSGVLMDNVSIFLFYFYVILPFTVEVQSVFRSSSEKIPLYVGVDLLSLWEEVNAGSSNATTLDPSQGPIFNNKNAEVMNSMTTEEFFWVRSLFPGFSIIFWKFQIQCIIRNIILYMFYIRNYMIH